MLLLSFALCAGFIQDDTRSSANDMDILIWACNVSVSMSSSAIMSIVSVVGILQEMDSEMSGIVALRA